jgi:hypothetical protein
MVDAADFRLRPPHFWLAKTLFAGAALRPGRKSIAKLTIYRRFNNPTGNTIATRCRAAQLRL